MEYIREVIESVNENESVDAKKSITKIVSEIKKFQYKIKTHIESNYTDFLPKLAINESYLEEGDKLCLKVDNLLQNIENETKMQLINGNDELQNCIEELNEISLGLKVSYKILKIDDLFQLLETAKSSDEPLKVMDIVSELKSLIYESKDNIFPRLDCYENIKIRYQIESQMMLHNLKLKFESLVQFVEKSFQTTKSVNLKITKDENQLHETLIALINSKYDPKKICTFLLENIFEPIITKPVSIEFNGQESGFATLQLSYSLKSSMDLRPNYKIVFKNIETALLCLGNMNISIDENLCVFTIFADYIKQSFFDLLIHECLDYAIPNTMTEMEASSIVSDIYELNKFLSEMLFINEQDTNLLIYAEKMEILFRNRFCANILDKSIEIMRKDLHETTHVSDDKSKNDSAAFSHCMISKSTLELISLLERVVKEAAGSKVKEFSDRLLSTISIILDRYLTEVPTFHSKLLSSIPQQSALFHNNCMYLAHWITQHTDKDIDSLGNIIRSLKHQGTEQFSSQIKIQRNQIMEILKEFDVSSAISELDESAQKVVRQCLSQLNKLKNVWQPILPENVYNKTIGNLLNDFCSEIIRKIMIVEDIPTPVSNGLVEICGIILLKAPQIFQDPVEVTVSVKTWMKLAQLKMILNASLVEITELWSEGKGPLTLNYKAEDVKHLVRALFQNTDRRANALASIV